MRSVEFNVQYFSSEHEECRLLPSSQSLLDSVPQQLEPPLQVIVSTSASDSDNMKLTAVSPTLGSSRKVSLAS